MLCFSLWGNSKVGWIHNEGVNGVESTLTMWHKEAFCCDNHMVGKGFIVIFGQHLKSKTKSVMVNVYASCNLSENVALWEELSNIKSAHQNLV